MSAEERDNQTMTEERSEEELHQQEAEREQHARDNNDVDVGDQQRVIHAQLGEMTELESFCPKCELNGTTRLMITDIPFFKKIIVSSFSCPHCNESNTEITFGGEYGPKRTRHHLYVKSAADMARQIVKSEFATLKIPELELEMPRETQKGSLNTIEGILVQTIDGLKMEQPVRRVMNPEFAAKIDAFCDKLETYRGGEIPFSVILDDPAGNSFIEPRYDYYHPTIDPQLHLFFFTRTPEERVMLSLPTEDEERALLAAEEEAAASASAAEGAAGSTSGNATKSKSARQNDTDDGDQGEGREHLSSTDKHAASEAEKRKKLHAMYNTLRTRDEESHLNKGEMAHEVIEVEERCPACFKESNVKMYPCDIPHFRETIIMAFKCDHCGYKSTEIQTGGQVPAKGRRITLRVLNESDLKRDVLKSNTASLEIPELELELVAGTLGGFFTTIQGLLNTVYENLSNTPQTDFCGYGDSQGAKDVAEEAKEPGQNRRMQTSMAQWLVRVKDAIDGNVYPLTFILDDPMAAIYIQNPREHLPPPDNADPQLTVEEYVRTFEQDEDLGLNDMTA